MIIKNPHRMMRIFCDITSLRYVPLARDILALPMRYAFGVKETVAICNGFFLINKVFLFFRP